jgi:hypothetical protein
LDRSTPIHHPVRRSYVVVSYEGLMPFENPQLLGRISEAGVTQKTQWHGMVELLNKPPAS